MTIVQPIRSKTARKVYVYMQKHPGESILPYHLVDLQIMDSLRQARYALRLLLDLELVRKIPDIRDCRSFNYILIT